MKSTIHEKRKVPPITGVREHAKIVTCNQRKRSKLKLSVLHHSSEIENWSTDEENL